MKKICYVTTISMSIEAFFIPQLRYLAENGFDVTAVCSPDNGLQERLGKTVRYVPIPIPRGVSVFVTVKAIASLTKFFKMEQFDLIQYSTPNAAFCASIAAKCAGCKVRNYHMMGFRYMGAAGLGRTILKNLDRMACNTSTHIECVSRSNLEWGIKEKLFPSGKAVVVWNGSSGGVDLKRFDCAKRDQWRKEIREELGFSADDFVFGFVGRICRDKGINELLEAFFDLKGGAKLLAVGVVEDRGHLDAALFEKAKDSSDVLFHTFVEDIERYYAAMDVLVLPSYREGFGMAVAEAAAVGTPAIVSDIPGPRDVIEEGKTAVAIPSSDAKALLEAMIWYEKNKDKAKKMGMTGVEFIKSKFDSITLNQHILERKELLISK